MAPLKQHTPEMPSLPCTSIDFDVLSAALRAGKPGDEAIAAASPTPDVSPAPVPEIEE